jgi:hypothetical protein
MRLFDEKDIRILAKTMDAVGPESVYQRADLILAAAKRVMVFPKDLLDAIKRDADEPR